MGETTARYVVLRHGPDGPSVEAADVVSLNGDGAGLAGLFRSLSPRPAGVVCTLSLELAAIRAMLLPPTTEDNLEAMISLEAEQMMPFAAAELSLGYQVYGINEQSRLEVMLVAARQEAVEGLLARVNVAPWMSAVASLPALCLANAVLSDAGATTITPGEHLVLVVLSDHGAELVTFQGGRVREARFVGLSTDERPEEGVLPLAGRTRLAQEIQRSTQAVSYASGQQVSRILMCGALAADEGLLEQIHEQSEVECLAWAPEALGEVAPWKEAPAYAVAYGAALQAAGLAQTAINLTPQRITERRQARRERQSRLAWGALVASIVLSAGAVFGVALHQRETLFLEQRARYEAFRKEAIEQGWPLKPGADKAIKAAQDAIVAASSQPVTVLEMLDILNQDLPPSVWLSDMSYNSGSGVVVRGYALNSLDPHGVLLSLIRQQKFEQVTQDYVNQETLDDQPVWSFQFTCKLPKPEPATRKR